MGVGFKFSTSTSTSTSSCDLACNSLKNVSFFLSGQGSDPLESSSWETVQRFGALNFRTSGTIRWRRSTVLPVYGKILSSSLDLECPSSVAVGIAPGGGGAVADQCGTSSGRWKNSGV